MAASAARAASRRSGLGRIRTKRTMGAVTGTFLPKAGRGWRKTDELAGGWSSPARELGRALFEEGATRLLPVLAREGPVDVGHLEAQLVLHVDGVGRGDDAALEEAK